MKYIHRFLAVAAPLLLAACVSAPPVRMQGDAALMQQQETRERALAGTDHWTVQGQLGVSDGKDGGSGSLTWVQDGDRYEFTMRAPVTGKSFRLSGDSRGALLEGIDGGPLRGPDAETLMMKALGWSVPLHNLRAWVLGLRADSGPAELAFGENRLPSLLQQDGWSVDYRAWDETRQPPVPTKVFATKPPYRVKLAIDSWTFQ
ncbi:MULTISPECIES: lipoprotein insertase outer membrane protein LolB [Dyella]|uniref:Outer-membrane lipoprotein LolB n=2 Tax=Dyella TaxID=231454 RepID=A0A4R0YRJ9_9GAMM|nr:MULTISPECIES: lipoprotein insertase outer membrane protein LolB [Dyella]TBR37263.1 outer membrane lipoprotein LolB [Dyella terrae]TCI07647.1 outer membrane lipoprotein LolB [Dyella soli]